jgi:hypothetical protein
MKQLRILFLLVVSLFVFSCSTPEIEPDVCLNGNCGAEFWVSTLGHPGTYKDANDVWHIKHANLDYFTIKGKINELDPHYVINGVPLVVTAFDSNMFYTLGNVIWTYPVYSYLGLWSSNQMNTPIPIGTQTYTFPQLIQQTTVENLAGYEIQHNPNVNMNHPAYKTYFSTYSKYNYNPQQNMVFFDDFEGMSATIYIEVTLGENKKTITKELKIIFEP